MVSTPALLSDPLGGSFVNDTPSLSQIDKLGERLKLGTATTEDLHLLDSYRMSFGPIYDFVVEAIRNQLKHKPTGRPAKTTYAIIAKLRRGSFRLSQIQDIAGCRIVVNGIHEQDEVVEDLMRYFPRKTLDDKREDPVFGYRAVHIVAQPVIATTRNMVVEIQVRTALQDLWAEFSEKHSDLDPSIKYGGGGPDIRAQLDDLSREITTKEWGEAKSRQLNELRMNGPLSAEDREMLEYIDNNAPFLHDSLEKTLTRLAKQLPPMKERP